MNSEEIKMAFIGGLIIGLASALLLLFNGRIAGIGGIAGRLITFRVPDLMWRLDFVIGLVIGGLLLKNILPASFDLDSRTPVWILAIAGLLVGFGSTEGNGCTSGHGVCGISRLSKRSIAATLTFMAAGIVTVFILRQMGAYQ
ncbi:MAG: YeeE/YedE family protein [Pseudobdellovibrio sp.]|nr:YeeE/YedE family protein [Pseudobdellovibrio sp.]